MTGILSFPPSTPYIMPSASQASKDPASCLGQWRVRWLRQICASDGRRNPHGISSTRPQPHPQCSHPSLLRRLGPPDIIPGFAPWANLPALHPSPIGQPLHSIPRTTVQCRPRRPGRASSGPLCPSLSQVGTLRSVGIRR